MTPSDWDAWLRSWLKRHPLKAPRPAPDRLFTEQVMARIRAEQAPARPQRHRAGRPVPVLLRWVPRPRLAFALGGVLAAALALVVWLQRPAERILTQIERDSRILLEAGELWTWPEASLEEEWQEYDRIVLAQAVEQTGTISEEQEVLKLWEELEGLEEFPPLEEPESAEGLSEELLWLDEMELAVS